MFLIIPYMIIRQKKSYNLKGVIWMAVTEMQQLFQNMQLAKTELATAENQFRGAIVAFQKASEEFLEQGQEFIIEAQEWETEHPPPTP